MKRFVFVALLFLVPAAYGQSVTGEFRIESDLGSGSVAVSATGLSGGRASGDIVFAQPIEIPDQDVDGDRSGDPSVRTTLELRVDVDCMRLEGTRAVLSGRIRTATPDTYSGRRVLFTFEDNAALERTPDAWTWGMYRPAETGWVPSDAELREDPGVGMTWWATDAEREDDRGVSSVPHVDVDCESFTLASYELQELRADSGDIVVKP